MSQADFQTQAFTPDRLIQGDAREIESRGITLLTGQNLGRGAVLGKITASGKYILSLSGAVDGSEVPAAILAEATDATAVDVATPAYIGGVFNEDLLVLGAAHTLASIREGLRGLGITLVSPIKN